MGKTLWGKLTEIRDPSSKYGVNSVTVYRRGSVKSCCNRSCGRGPPRCLIRGSMFGSRPHPRPSSKPEPSSSSEDKPVLEDDSNSHSLLVVCSRSTTGEKLITNNNSDSEPHSYLTKCSSSTIGGQKGATEQSSDSDFHSTVKAAVAMDRKKGKKRQKSGGNGSEERKGKKTKKNSLLVTE